MFSSNTRMLLSSPKLAEVEISEQEDNEENLEKAVVKEILSSAETVCYESEKQKFLNNLKTQSFMTPKEFQKECDKVFTSDNKNDIFNYVTQSVDNKQNAYILNKFNEYFANKMKDALISFREQHLTKYGVEIKNAKQNIKLMSDYLNNYYKETSKSSDLETRILRLCELIKTFNSTNRSTGSVTLLKKLKEFKNQMKSNKSLGDLDDESIGLLQTFFSNMLREIEKLKDPSVEITNVIQKEVEVASNPAIQAFKEDLYKKTIGCTFVCPFCGVKCEQAADDKHKHSTEVHRIMAFGGCNEYIGDKKGFTFDICNSKKNLEETHWGFSDVKNALTKTKPRSQGIQERIERYHLSDTALRITLFWEDRNDLDLHLNCPCGTKIFYGNKRCNTCRMQLEHDMNVCCHEPACNTGNCRSNRSMGGCSRQPAEHICFIETNDTVKLNKPKFGRYVVSVNYFCQNSIQPAPSVSKFDVEIAIGGKQYKMFKQLQVSIKQTVTVCEFDLNQYLLDSHIGSDNIDLGKMSSNRFSEHISQFETTKDWNMAAFPPSTTVEQINNMKKAWIKIRDMMKNKYGNLIDFDNTPADFL